uniref:2OG-Fe(II) oxygenase n=1 Tax=Ningiella ruwaisensis TaxID=2364274 RepID=UPI00109FF12D|nr:2OG-Fe(II) oxygenase [Ningiella ruwaisensis]
MSKVSTSDFVRIIDDALPQELCQRFVETIDASNHLQPGHTGSGVDKSMKNSMDVSIQRHDEFAPIRNQVFEATTKHIIEYFKDFYFALIGPIALTLKDPKSGQPVKLSADNFEQLALPNLSNLVQYLFRLGEINAQRYKAGEGGYPYWHSEIYPQQGSVEALHRNLLFMFYLNDVEQGGETEFFYQKKKITPKAGRMVIAPAGFTHTHRGNVPVSNDKYILTSWVLFNPAEHIFRS